MKVTLTAQITIETDADVTAERLINEFDEYMNETIGSPVGNIFDQTTGGDQGEIVLINFTVGENQ